MATARRLGLDAPGTERWASYVNAWGAGLQHAGRSESTAAGYVKHLSWLAGDLAALYPDPMTLTPETLARWLAAQNWSESTRRRVMVSLRSFYAWALLEGHTRRSPLAGVPVVPSRPGPARRRTPPAWAGPIGDYLATLRAGARQPGTLTVTRARLMQLATTFADPWSVTAEDLTLWLSRDDWAPETKRGAMGTARSFYRWALRSGHVSANPAEDLETVTLRRTLPRPTPDAALAQALAAADDRTRLVLVLAALGGLRRAEIAGLHTHDFTDHAIRVHGKGGHERMVPMNADLAGEVETVLGRRRRGDPPGTGWAELRLPVDGWVFPSKGGGHLTPEHVGRLVVRVLPDGWTCHTLRHRFATQAYADAHDLIAVQELLGHATVETTRRYAKAAPGALVAAVAGVHL